MRSLPITLVLLFSLLAPLGAARVWACGGGSSAHPAAFPGAAADVSPQSSLFVVNGADEVPVGLALQVNGAAVPLPAVAKLGTGVTADGFGTFFRIAGPLQASSDYVLQMTGATGAPVALTHFQTAASYDKTPGTAATIDGLRLWRVHYPKRLVNAGGCVGSEYEGYFALDFTPPTLPGTPAAEVVSVLSLASAELGTVQQFVFTGGVTSLPGGLTTVLTGDGVTLPEGGALSAGAALWRPNLEPGRMYCATIGSYGRNDLATGAPLESASSCAVVMGIEYGAGGAGGAGTGAAAGAGGAAGAAGTGGAACGAAGGTNTDGGAGGGSGGVASYPIGDDIRQAGGGCGCATAPGGEAGAAALWLVAVAVARLRRRRGRSDV